jgi:hypothetical protein
MVGKKTTPPPAGVDIAIVAAIIPNSGINHAVDNSSSVTNPFDKKIENNIPKLTKEIISK